MKKILLLAGSLLLSSVALAAPPGAPVVTVGASNVKQLQFDWPAVPGAARYELWYLVGPGGQWIKYLETPAQKPIVRINVSVHLLVWPTARYRVAACNSGGCTNSAEVSVANLANDVPGFLKPNFRSEGHWFGAAVALSADGLTAAVSMAYEAGQNYGNGVAYVYRRASATAAWKFEARLMPNLFRASSPLYDISLNGDGTVIALGRAEGIGGQSFNGAVYIFRRSGTTWTQEKRLASGIDHDNFGRIVNLDDSGNTLAVGREGRTSSPGYGLTEIYSHTAAGWQPTKTLVNPAPAGGYAYCHGMALSGDGKTLVRTCNIQGNMSVVVNNAPAWTESARVLAGDSTEIATNYDGTLFVVRRTRAYADIYRLQQGVWSQDAGSPFDLGGDSTDISHLFTCVAMSGDGKFIAVGDGLDMRGTVGPNYPPISATEGQNRGSVFVLERKAAGWKLRRMMKQGVVGSTDYGVAVDLSHNAHELIVGAPFDRSGATGMQGDPADTSTPANLGAAWLY